jgi:hypothetical protein
MNTKSNDDKPNDDKPNNKPNNKPNDDKPNDDKPTQTYEQYSLLENEKRCISQYRKNMKTFLLTSRFNEKTRQENTIYRQKRNLENGCLYCTPELVCQDIPKDANLMVLEMNNDKNEIMAIGLLKNTPYFDKYRVYEDTNYNRYSYVGKYRITREDISEEEEQIIKALDQLCFKGANHMKRGHGLKSFPVKILWRCKKVVDIIEFIENMFRKRMKQTNEIK